MEKDPSKIKTKRELLANIRDQNYNGSQSRQGGGGHTRPGVRKKLKAREISLDWGGDH